MSQRIAPPSFRETESYQHLIESIRHHYGDKLTDAELNEAARNLITFFKTMLEIKRKLVNNNIHDKHL